jgi:hypothetical protein
MTHLHRRAPWEYAGHTDHEKHRPKPHLPTVTWPTVLKSDRPKRTPREHFGGGRS